MTGLDDQFDPFKLVERAQTQAADKSETQQRFQVQLPSGSRIDVLTSDEADYLNGVVAAYATQYALDNVSDLSELDRLLGLELQSHRMNIWLGRRVDYDDKAVDENLLRQRLKDASMEIRQVKRLLGIDKLNRDRQTGKGSAYQRITDILDRARRFGLMRNEQAAKAHELAMELISLVDTQKNCATEKELRNLRVNDEDIVEWIDTTFRTEFMAIDAAYRERDQKMWILTEQ